MPDASFRLYFGDRAATEQELGRVEEISVEQEMDMAWQAQLKLGLCLDERGRWREQPDEFAEPFSRVRVELKLGDGDFQPLIDGPVVSYASALDSEPGGSTVTLVVSDDSVLMNREEGSDTFEHERDDAIASEVFGDAAQIADTRIEETSGEKPVTVRRSTPIQFLRKLARANEYHAYVLPGEQPGKSIGCFLPDPEDPGDLPPLKLLGRDRNLLDANITQNNEGPQRTVAHTLRISDQEVVSSERGTQDVALMRDFPAIADDQSALRRLPAQDNEVGRHRLENFGQHAGVALAVTAFERGIVDMDRVVCTHRQRCPQRFDDPVGAERDNGHGRIVFQRFLDQQRLFHAVLVVGIHDKFDSLRFDVRAVGVDFDFCLGVGYVFN